MSTPFVHRNLPRLLLQAREAVMLHTRPSLREHGLSDQQWRVLRVLGGDCSAWSRPAGSRARLFILGPSLTGVLTRMERDGLIRARARPGRTSAARWSRPRRKGTNMVSKLSAPIEAHYDVDGKVAGQARSWRSSTCCWTK
jgi:hypothetical protein